MENNNLTPVLQLRQDDVVAISLERYEKLIESETRLGMLRKMRFIEVTNNNSTYIQSEDHILGGMVLEALLANQEKEKQKNKEPNDE
jgi:hypothetical protein